MDILQFELIPFSVTIIFIQVILKMYLEFFIYKVAP